MGSPSDSGCIFNTYRFIIPLTSFIVKVSRFRLNGARDKLGVKPSSTDGSNQRLLDSGNAVGALCT
jgi:hypothetical protein